MKKNKIIPIILILSVFLLISFRLSAADDPATIGAEKSLHKGYQDYKSHDFHNAIKHFEKSYQLIPYSKTAYYLSRCYFELGDFPKTIFYADHALKDKPELDDVYVNNIKEMISLTSKRKHPASTSGGIEIEISGKADTISRTLSPEPDESEFELSEYTCYKIRNRWKDDQYLHIEHGEIECSKINQKWWSAQWIIEPIKATNFSRIRNRWKDDQYLHIEHGKIECSKINLGWWSAQWVIEPIEKTALSRIRNRWKDDQYLHIEHGKIECNKINPGVWSAQWIINPPLK